MQKGVKWIIIACLAGWSMLAILTCRMVFDSDSRIHRQCPVSAGLVVSASRFNSRIRLQNPLLPPDIVEQVCAIPLKRMIDYDDARVKDVIERATGRALVRCVLTIDGVDEFNTNEAYEPFVLHWKLTELLTKGDYERISVGDMLAIVLSAIMPRQANDRSGSVVHAFVMTERDVVLLGLPERLPVPHSGRAGVYKGP